MTQANAVQAAAELTVEEARAKGEQCRLASEIAAISVLETALAFAYAEAALFRGANDTPERLAATIRLMQQRLGRSIREQHFLMRGHKALERLNWSKS